MTIDIASASAGGLSPTNITPMPTFVVSSVPTASEAANPQPAMTVNPTAQGLIWDDSRRAWTSRYR
jgi:hypothetical protein